MHAHSNCAHAHSNQVYTASGAECIHSHSVQDDEDSARAESIPGHTANNSGYLDSNFARDESDFMHAGSNPLQRWMFSETAKFATVVWTSSGYSCARNFVYADYSFVHDGSNSLHAQSRHTPRVATRRTLQVTSVC